MGNNYSKELFWGAVDVVLNAANIWGTVTHLVMSRNKAPVGSIDEAVKTFSNFLNTYLYQINNLWKVVITLLNVYPLYMHA